MTLCGINTTSRTKSKGTSLSKLKRGTCRLRAGRASAKKTAADRCAPSTPLAVERPSLVVKADNALMLGAVTLMASPVAAQAAEITPSLKNLLGSVVAGGVIFGALFGA